MKATYPLLPLTRPTRLLDSLCCGYSQILLVRNPLLGALLIIAVGSHSPERLCYSLLGLTGALLAPRLSPRAAQDGTQSYNGILLGLAVAELACPPLLTAAIALLGGWLTVTLARSVARWLPPLTLPFVLLALLCQGLVPSIATPAPPPSGLLTPLVSLGQILFLPSAGAGLLLALGLLHAAPRALLLALGGASAGILLSWLAFATGLTAVPPDSLHGVNSALTALALGWYCRAGAARLLQALLLCVLLGLLSQAAGLTLFTLPFILSSWALLPRQHATTPDPHG